MLWSSISTVLSVCGLDSTAVRLDRHTNNAYNILSETHGGEPEEISSMGFRRRDYGKPTPVFFHYLVGTLDDAHAEIDIKLAKQTGADAFALNIANVVDDWAVGASNNLFKWAEKYDFKLFYSFDMTCFTDPKEFTDFLQNYTCHSAYYKHEGKPVVSTFNGGNEKFANPDMTVNEVWQRNLKDVMTAAGTPIYFMPAWPDAMPSVDFFHKYAVCDGAMQWNSWPYETHGKVDIGTADDKTYQEAAKKAGRSFMMGASPLQYKHLDANNSFYLRGKGNFNVRVEQVLAMQPDFVEFQSWNDVGEGHNLGTAWPEGIACCENIQAYSTDHTAFLEIMPTYIKAIKSGATSTKDMYPSNGSPVQGIFYYHKLLANADCSADPLGKPRGAQLVEDVVTTMIYLAEGCKKFQVVFYSDGKCIGSQRLKPGYNHFAAKGLTAGVVNVQVLDAQGNTIFSADGPEPVLASSSVCDYNIHVVALQPYAL